MTNSMETLKNAKARFDSSFNSIAYSIIANDGGKINTAEHYLHCAKLPFTSVKGDVRPTADGGLIMCHDAGFTLNDAGFVVGYNKLSERTKLIRNMTTAECLSLVHEAEGGNRVTDFETYIRICKRYGKIAYITIRDEGMEDVVPAMFAVLDKYHMRKHCIVNSFTVESLQAVRAVDEDIMLSNVLPARKPLTKEDVDRALSLGNCLVCTFTFPFTDYPEDVNGDGVIDGFDALENSKEALAYAREKDIRIYSAINNSNDHIDKLMAYGVMGVQINVAPEM